MSQATRSRPFSSRVSLLEPRSAVYSLRPGSKPRQRCSLPAHAALWALPDDIVGTLNTAAAVGIALSIGLSALPILTGDAKERNARSYYQPDSDGAADTVKWSVMGVLSFFPLVNPTVHTSSTPNHRNPVW
jgi:hypothetical protein